MAQLITLFHNLIVHLHNAIMCLYFGNEYATLNRF
ncbi:Uncharacterised protein [Vibrio cholerae]|nr:Uncharacterised protein [Vibrio cholerae]